MNVTTFIASKYLIGGTNNDVRVWQVADGKQVATIPIGTDNGVNCVATSEDGQWIAGGTKRGEVFVWNAKTYQQLFVDRSGREPIHDVDFSPDSTRLVSADNGGTIWDIAACQKVRTLDHDRSVVAAKYSPQGDRIATATEKSVRVWDSKDGHLLVDVKVRVKGWRSLPWCRNHLFVQTYDGTIKRINAATGSTVSEWSVPQDARRRSAITLPPHGKFIAYSAEKSITIWDAATHAQLSIIPHTHDIFSFAFSPDDSLLAIANVGSQIIVKKLFQSVFVRSYSIFNSSLLSLGVTPHPRT